MREEILIERKFGRPQPFKVPDGYFENFEIGMMAKLPLAKPKKRPVMRVLRPITWAACVVAVLIVTTFYLSRIFVHTDKRVASVSQIEISQQASTDYLIDELSDYTMMDNDDFYSFIADE